MNKRLKAKVYNTLLKRFRVRLDLYKKTRLISNNSIVDELNYMFKDKPYNIVDLGELLQSKPSEGWWKTNSVSGLQSYVDALEVAKQSCK